MKRILVVKLRHHGDVLLSSPVFSALKRAYPEAEIDAYIYRETLPMLEGHPAIANFILYGRGDSSWKILRAIRKKGYDCVLNLTEGDRGALAALISGAKVRVGYDSDKKAFKNKLYTHLVRPCQKPRHTVEKNLDAVRQLGIFPTMEERALTLAVPDSARLSVLSKLGVGEPYILVHPVARWGFKCWPEEKVVALCETLLARGERVVLSAGPAEGAMANRIAERVAVHNLAGQLNLKELAALIDMSKLLVCVDSVPLHMASALQVPVVALFGPTSDENWAPWQNPHARVVAKKVSCRPCYNAGCGGSGVSDCLERLALSEVLEAIAGSGVLASDRR